MALIAIVHWSFDNLGGGEAICSHILEALQESHSLFLITLKPPNFERLNEQFGTNISQVPVGTPKIGPISAYPLFQLLNQRISGGRIGVLEPLSFAIFNRACFSFLKTCDLVINTTCEMNTAQPTLQYIHYPLFNYPNNPYRDAPNNTIVDLLNKLVNFVAGLENGPSPRMMTNSQWTADLLERIYDCSPDVVYPPIDVSNLTSHPPIEEQEPGFVIAGRMVPPKRFITAINILKKVRQKHDVHLHIAGPESNEQYVQRIRSEAGKYDWIHFEGNLPRSGYFELLQTHRYGIHALEHEHFGIVIAEMVAAGALPFVHKSGGQREIVNEQTELLWTDTEDAVAKINQVLAHPPQEKALRVGLPDIAKKYSRKKFHQQICYSVDSALSSIR